MKTRQIVLIDAENLAGTGHLTNSAAQLICETLKMAIDISRNDIVIVGGDKHNVFQLGEIAKCFGGQIVLGTGPNGGDQALQNAFDQIPSVIWNHSDLPISRLVIASGDNFFSMAARVAKSRGYQVMTVSKQGSLSYSLAKNSTNHVYLPELISL
jgi:hypothetical protein